MKPRKPIRKVSNKRAKQNAEYSKRRKAFLEAHPICQWWLKENRFGQDDRGYFGAGESGCTAPWMVWRYKCPYATEIHHKRGRFGSRLNQEEFWLAVSREGHDWIHANPKEAYEKGYLLPR
jgi:hypothetical protein